MNEIIIDFIEESDKYGFDIKKSENDKDLYICTTKCNVCNNIFSKEISIDIVKIKDKENIKCELPMVCNGCIEACEQKDICIDKICYIEDVIGGYFCYEKDADYFLNEYFKNAGGVICTKGTKEELEKEFGNFESCFYKKENKNN